MISRIGSKAVGLIAIGLASQACGGTPSNGNEVRELTRALSGVDWAWLKQPNGPARDVAVGASGVVYKLGYSIPGKVSRYTPHNGPDLWTTLRKLSEALPNEPPHDVDVLAKAIAVDPNGRVWAVNDATNAGHLELAEWDGQDKWTAYDGPPCSSAKDIAISENFDVFVTCGAPQVADRVYRWSVTAAAPSWQALGDATRVAVGASDEPWIVDAKGQVFHLDTESYRWILFPAAPASDIAVGKGGVWITLKTPDASGNNISFLETGATPFRVSPIRAPFPIGEYDGDHPELGPIIGYFATGAAFQPQPGNATAIAADEYTDPFIVSSGQLRHWERYQRFESSFEAATDFNLFYSALEPAATVQADYLTETGLVGLVTQPSVRDGFKVHGARILSKTSPTESVDARCKGTTLEGTNLCGTRHRAYPTIQFRNSAYPSGLTQPTLVTLWVQTDVTLNPGLPIPGGERFGHAIDDDDWLSLATFTNDDTDAWTPTLTVNLNRDRQIVVNYGTGDSNIPGSVTNKHRDGTVFPTAAGWVRLDMYLDLEGGTGIVKVWQNQKLVTEADVPGGWDRIRQAHFGLYASARVASGYVLNDKLRMLEVADASEAGNYVRTPW